MLIMDIITTTARRMMACHIVLGNHMGLSMVLIIHMILIMIIHISQIIRTSRSILMIRIMDMESQISPSTR